MIGNLVACIGRRVRTGGGLRNTPYPLFSEWLAERNRAKPHFDSLVHFGRV